MRFTSKIVSKSAAVALVLPALLITGCQKQNNSNAQAPQEKMAGGGHQRLRAVCADDIQKYCANADRLRRCLRDNIDKLSDPCKTAVMQRGGHQARGDGGSDQ